MSREEIAASMRWPTIVWIGGVINILAGVPQLLQIVNAGSAAGVSLPMFVMLLIIQIIYAMEGYFTRNSKVMVTVGLSGVVSLFVIIAILIYGR